jgi:predicted neuraminidase
VFRSAPNNHAISLVRHCCDGDSCDWHTGNLHGGRDTLVSLLSAAHIAVGCGCVALSPCVTT